jgi:hypothetical protein
MIQYYRVQKCIIIIIIVVGGVVVVSNGSTVQSMLGGSFATTAWRVLGLRME